MLIYVSSVQKLLVTTYKYGTYGPRFDIEQLEDDKTWEISDKFCTKLGFKE